ncbi:hypothetical protein EDB89DRAFT_2063983 [Lactarius sanguifluus]|nr:hypothetical protein EDB89DRAFT_2063983 [Lactarius sanguifluus]
MPDDLDIPYLPVPIPRTHIPATYRLKDTRQRAVVHCFHLPLGHYPPTSKSRASLATSASHANTLGLGQALYNIAYFPSHCPRLLHYFFTDPFHVSNPETDTQVWVDPSSDEPDTV